MHSGNRGSSCTPFCVSCGKKCLPLPSSMSSSVYFVSFSYELAERDCSAALEIDPQHLKSLYRRAVARRCSSRYTAALEGTQICVLTKARVFSK